MTALSSLKSLYERVPERARQPAIDTLAFVVIALALGAFRVKYAPHGLAFDDASWYLHFGKRVLDGAVPYRDFIFQVGPLPIYVDALFQKLFGSTYMASLYAGTACTIVRCFVVWLIARRLGSPLVAAPLMFFCALDPIFSYAHHWSTPYAQLFITVSGLFFVRAASAKTDRRAFYELAFAGAGAALVTSSRQSSAIMIAIVLFVTTAAMLVRGEYFTKKRFIALWGGYAGGLALMFLPLAAIGALRPCIQQMFLDAPAKKAVHGIDAVLDALSGGALLQYRYDPSFTWWSAVFAFLALPIAVVTVALYLLSRKDDVAARSVSLLALPVLVILGLFARYATLEVASDLPRTLFTVTSVLAVVFPARCRQWLGIEPLVAVGLGTIPLSSDWALEMSFPGRGWGDAPALVTGLILFCLASRRLTDRLRLVFTAALGVVGIVHVIVLLRANLNPVARMDTADGTLLDNNFEVDLPVLRGVKVNEPRKKTIEWFRANIPPGSSCFVYGNFPVLYTLLECMNPTALDTTAGDFFTGADGDAAIAALRAHPPDFIITNDRSWMNPPILEDLGGDINRYDGLNPKASLAIHMGLRSIIDQYEQIGTVAEMLGPEQAKWFGNQRDRFEATRLFRRKTSASP